MSSQNVENAKSLFTYVFIAVARFPIVPDSHIDDIENLPSSMQQKSRKHSWPDSGSEDVRNAERLHTTKKHFQGRLAFLRDSGHHMTFSSVTTFDQRRSNYRPMAKQDFVDLATCEVDGKE